MLWLRPVVILTATLMLVSSPTRLAAQMNGTISNCEQAIAKTKLAPNDMILIPGSTEAVECLAFVYAIQRAIC